VRIFKNGQVDFAGRVLLLGVTFDGQGTILLMVESPPGAGCAGG